jgi:hypothetical protein
MGGSCAANDVPFTQFATDLQAGTLPSFGFLTPNKYNDMHTDQKKAPCLLANTTLNKVCQGDRWLSQNLPPLLALNDDATMGNDVTVILTFDEGSTKLGGGGRILTLVSGPNVTPGQNDTMFGHLASSTRWRIGSTCPGCTPPFRRCSAGVDRHPRFLGLSPPPGARLRGSRSASAPFP